MLFLLAGDELGLLDLGDLELQEIDPARLFFLAHRVGTEFLQEALEPLHARGDLLAHRDQPFVGVDDVDVTVRHQQRLVLVLAGDADELLADLAEGGQRYLRAVDEDPVFPRA